MSGKDTLAIDGGEPSVHLNAGPPKVGVEELFELIDLWGFSPERKRELCGVILEGEPPRGPHLFRYYGPAEGKVDQAEEAMRDFVGAAHCLAVNSCTSALMCAMKALGVGMGDEVIVPAYTFFATVAAVVASNAVPVIVEIDESLCLDPESVERAITARTKAVAAVHMRGGPADMNAILDVAGRHGLAVIEDVAQAAGGTFEGKTLGSLGTIGCFSFDFYKAAVSGEGGFVTTDDEWLHTRAQSWHDTAACWRPDRYARERREGELFCGENYRMSELCGAVALAQIRKLPEITRGTRRSHRRIREALDLPASCMLRRSPDPDGDAGTHVVVLLPDADTAQRAIQAAKAEGVPAGGVYDKDVRDWHIYYHWEHILERKAVSPDGLPWSVVPEAELPRYSKDMCPRTLDILGRSLHVAVRPHYTDEECDMIAAAVNRVLAAYVSG